jgi:ribulose-phosphate 3-epimerase
MAIICPTVLASDPHEYREQFERIQPFAERIQVDLADGDFAPTKTVSLEQLWWSDSDKIDLHLMYRKPADHILELIRLSPHMVIVHAEADGDFVEFSQELHQHGIRAGVALLVETEPEVIKPAMDYIDHVLIFSGDLGRFGGQADLTLLEKVKLIKSWKPEIEIGWDGGVNDRNAAALADGGVNVLNVGGFIQNAEEPKEAYTKLKAAIG